MPEIKALGADVLTVMPQRPEFSRQMRQKNKLEFDLLRDEGNRVAESFGLRFTLPDYLQTLYQQIGADLPRFNGDDSWALPMPARFVVNRDRIVTAADYDPDYTRRPEVAKTIEDVRRLHG